MHPIWSWSTDDTIFSSFHRCCTHRYGPCSEPKGTPKCTKKCVNGDSWLADKHHGASTYNLKGVDAMMQEIYTNGPIEGMFFVFQVTTTQ